MGAPSRGRVDLCEVVHVCSWQHALVGRESSVIFGREVVMAKKTQVSKKKVVVPNSAKASQTSKAPGTPMFKSSGRVLGTKGNIVAKGK